MSRILVTGSNGQVGWELQRTLSPLGEVIALDRRGMDLADPDSIRRAIHEAKPALIVNAAAYTAVDLAEAQPDLAMAVNGIAPGIIAEAAKRMGAALATRDYPTLAVRPKNSRLDCTRLLERFGITLPAWQESLRLCMEELRARTETAA